MDPTEALNRLRAALEGYREAESEANDYADAGSEHDAKYWREVMAERAEDVAEFAEALDGWLTRGGFLPTWWQSGDPQGPDTCKRCGVIDPIMKGRHV